jgi:hypothetical protein
MNKAGEAQDKITQRIEELDSQPKARIAALDTQIAAAKDTTQEKFQKRKSEIQADYKDRKAKLDASMALVKEALT